MAGASLEVIATSVADAVAAAEGGADRLEVVQTMSVGGLTPATETVARIRERVSLPLRVMLRANGGFQTDPAELDRLCLAARELRALGADAFVFGFLTPEGRLDLPVLRALADAAADDPDVDEAYGQLVNSFVDVTAEHIEHEIAAGRILPLDARETAKALVWMNERYLTLSLGREPTTDRAVVARALDTIWSRVLYGTG